MKSVDSKIAFFIDYWKDYLQGIDNLLHHTLWYDPITLFREFSDEIKIKEFNNKDNKDFFINTINEFSKLPIQSLDTIKSTLTLIKRQFNHPNFSYLLHLLKEINQELQNFTFAKKCIDELIEELLSSKDLNEEKVKLLVRLIINFLRHKKYSNETIAKIIEDIFSGYQFHNGVLHTSYPYEGIEYNGEEVGTDEFKIYQDKIQKLMDSLDHKKRLEALYYYFNKKPERLIYIFQIRGLKGDIVFELGDVTIYSPKYKKLSKNGLMNCDEFFDLQGDITYSNGAIAIDMVDREFGQEEALSILEKTLDIIAGKYITYKKSFEINTDTTCVLNSDYTLVGNSMSAKNSPFFQYQDSLTLQELDFEYIESGITLLKKKDPTSNKILDSMHWHRKAIESARSNERLLWSWVTMENLFPNTKMLIETIPKIMSKRALYNFAWKHFHKLEYIVTSPYLNLYRKKVELPHTLLTRISLKSKVGKVVHLQPFIDNVPEIVKHVHDLHFKQQLLDLHEMFQDQGKVKEILEKFESIYYEKILMIYRIRNKIVHNANNDFSPINSDYANDAIEISSIVLGTFIDKNKCHETIEDILNSILYGYDSFKVELDENGVDVLLNKRDENNG